MSSSATRTAILGFLQANSSEKVVDMSTMYGELADELKAQGVDHVDWLGVEFIGHDEEPVSLPATNVQGTYRETGAVYFHVVAVAKLGVGDSLLTRAETLRGLFRGQNISGVVVESVTPMNSKQGATLSFEGGYVSGSFLVGYHKDIQL